MKDLKRIRYSYIYMITKSLELKKEYFGTLKTKLAKISFTNIY